MLDHAPSLAWRERRDAGEPEVEAAQEAPSTAALPQYSTDTVLLAGAAAAAGFFTAGLFGFVLRRRSRRVRAFQLGTGRSWR